MFEQTKTVLTVCSCVMSLIAIGYATACHSMVKSCNDAWKKDIGVAVEKAKADQQVKNDAFVDYGEHVGERLIEISGKVAVLEAKNIVSDSPQASNVPEFSGNIPPSDIEYDRFSESLESLTVDDREKSKVIYTKMIRDILSLSDDDVKYAVTGHGSVALQVTFSRKLREKLSQGVPESSWSEFEKQQNGGFGSAIGATVRLCQRLRLTEPFDVIIAATICSKPDIEVLWELNEQSKRLIDRNTSEIDDITGHQLDYFKEQRLLRPLLNEYLDWVRNRNQK